MRRACSVILILALSAGSAVLADQPAQAEPSGDLTADVVPTAGPFGVRTALADVTGDGRLDLVVDNVFFRGSASGPVTSSALNLGPGAIGAAGDFDGDGFDDLVLGDPTHGGNAGRVLVHRGSAGGPRVSSAKPLSQDGEVEGVAEQGDAFGTALAAGDFNRDGFTDLAIGAPTEDVGSRVDAGAVNVLYGSAQGLDPKDDALFSQQGLVYGEPEPGDRFGAALVSGDFDGDGFADLAIGVPNESLGAGLAQAGLVSVLYGSPDGLGPEDQSTITQGGEWPGAAEAGDQLGAAMTAGDADGDGVTDLVIGAPGEDLTVNGLEVPDAGAILTAKGTGSGLSPVGAWSLTQSGRLGGRAESHEQLGRHLEMADLDGDRRQDLLIGVPEETVDGVDRAGRVYVVPGTYVGLEGYGNWSFDKRDTDLGGIGVADRFGASLVAGDLDGSPGIDVAVAAPGDATAGGLRGSVGFVTPQGSLWPGPFPLADDPGLDAVTWLADQLESRGYSVSVSVLGDGEGEIYSYDGGDDLIPASNQKVITAAGAFELLPEEFRFETIVEVDSHRNLVIKAGGDPTLTSADLAAMAAEVATSPHVRFIEDVIVDAGRYGPDRLAPGVLASNLPTWTGPLSAFIVDDNRHRRDAEYLAWPEIGNAEILVDALQALGVEVRGSTYVAASPPTDWTVARHVSADRDALLLRMLLYSDNEIADSLVREIGYRASGLGTMRSGKQAIAGALERFGVDLSGAGDGSGLSYANQVSAGEYTRLLESVRTADWFPTFYFSLPIGATSGTLVNRFGGWLTAGKVRAKTGSLFISRALSGYTDTPDVRLVTFSIVVNGQGASSTTGTIDLMTTILSGLG